MKIRLTILGLCAALLTGCGVSIKYSLSGCLGSCPDAKTFSVAYFPNNATMVSPILSSTLTEALVDMFHAPHAPDAGSTRAATSPSRARSSTTRRRRPRCRATTTRC